MESFDFNGNATDYRVQRLDCLLIDHLWSSETSHLWTDFEFIAATDMKRFSAHKFILAARSAVFASIFSKKVESQSSQVEPVDSNTMEQFLKFIYTGQLVGPISSSDLGQLATKYQISTLQQLCESASLSSSIDAAANISDEINEELTRSEGDNSSSSNMATASTFSWDLKLPLPGQDFRKSSKSFRNSKRVKMFEAKVRLIGEEHYPRQILYVTLTFVSFIQNYTMNFITKELFYSITYSRDEKCEKFEELKKVTSTHSLNKTFSGHIGIRHDSKPTAFITFRVNLQSSILNFDLKLIDTSLGQQLWAASVNNIMTDFVFLIGEESIGAHRFILSARSPVFAVMLSIGMTESRSGKVHLIDVHPSSFRHFLEFIYTGMVPPKANREEMFRLADQYGVETLMTVSNPQQIVGKDGKTGSSKPFSSCSIL